MTKSVTRLVATIFAAVMGTAAATAQWNIMTISTSCGGPCLYGSWTECPNPPTCSSSPVVNDVLSLRPEAFGGQQFANPHVAYADNGDWIIMGYGFTPITGNTIGDSINIMTRINAGSHAGKYILHRPLNPVMHNPPAIPPENWTTVGGMGAGAGFTKTDVASAGGYKFFALLPVGNTHGAPVGGPPDGSGCAPPGTTTPARGWVTMAVSTNGTSWYFVPPSGTAPVAPDNPDGSKLLLKRIEGGEPHVSFLFPDAGCAPDHRWHHIYWHQAMMYNKYDQFFYIALGYDGACGLKTTWWRVKFVPGATFGLGAIERFDRSLGKFVSSDGTIPDDGDVWQCNGQDPQSTAQNALTGPADPMDLIMLFNNDGSFNSVLFLYKPEMDYGNALLPGSQHIFYTRGGLPTSSTGNFVWDNPQQLDAGPLTSLYEGGCGGGGGYYVSANQSGFDPVTGYPKPFGFVSTFRKSLHPDWSCSDPADPIRQGVLPVLYSLQRAQPSSAAPAVLDTHSASGTTGNLNGVFEPGETVQVETAWQNTGTSSTTATGSVTYKAPGVRSFGGPGTGTYTTVDAAANYGTIGVGATKSCYTGTPNCYVVGVAGSRPATHWDSGFTEQLSNGLRRLWLLHLGGSFTDVPQSHTFYKAIETIFHKGITSGCTSSSYCPTDPVTRAQMAVFLVRVKYGATYTPPSCTGLFADVTCPTGFAVDFIEKFYADGITSGCLTNPLRYCPTDSATRAQMAIFLLRTKLGSTYTPPPATGLIFSDVHVGDFAADWIEELSRQGGVAAGNCGAGKYCPNDPTTRGQMAGFMTNTFGFALYGP